MSTLLDNQKIWEIKRNLIEEIMKNLLSKYPMNERMVQHGTSDSAKLYRLHWDNSQ